MKGWLCGGCGYVINPLPEQNRRLRGSQTEAHYDGLALGGEAFTQYAV